MSHEEAARQVEALARTTPERAAQIIHEGAKAARSRILVGPETYVFDALARLTPTHYFGVLAGLDRLVSRRAQKA